MIFFDFSALGGPGFPAPPSARGASPPPRLLQDAFFFSLYFQWAFWLILARFSTNLIQLGLQNQPKSMKKTMPRGLPKLSPFFNGFLMDSWCQLQPPEPSKSLFFLRKNKVFSKNHSSKLASIFDAISVPTWLHFPSKIYQKPIKIKSQEAFKNWLISASIFNRFGGGFGRIFRRFLIFFFRNMPERVEVNKTLRGRMNFKGRLLKKQTNSTTQLQKKHANLRSETNKPKSCSENWFGRVLGSI